MKIGMIVAKLEKKMKQHLDFGWPFFNYYFVDVHFWRTTLIIVKCKALVKIMFGHVTKS